ncbi:unnamed protein product [Discosporangium mesarthrocarpum]
MRGDTGGSDYDSTSDSGWDFGGSGGGGELPKANGAEVVAAPNGPGARRASCDFCSRRKRKCNGREPCQNCSKLNLLCHFSLKRKSGRKRKPRPEDEPTTGGVNSGVSTPAVGGQGRAGAGMKPVKRRNTATPST